jgi:hypothetical protein
VNDVDNELTTDDFALAEAIGADPTVWEPTQWYLRIETMPALCFGLADRYYGDNIERRAYVKRNG